MPSTNNRRNYRSYRGRSSKSKKESTKDRQQDRAIAKIQRQQLRAGQYKATGESTATYYAYPLVTPNTWQGVFQSNFRGENPDRCFVQNVDIMTNLTVNVSGVATFAPMHYAIFVVKIKKPAQMQTIARLGPSLATMTEDIDYTYEKIGTTVGNAQWRLNPAIYDIKASRRGMVGNYAVQDAAADAPFVTNITDANKNHRMIVKHTPTLKRTYGVNAAGANQEWKDMTVNQVNVRDQLFLVFFNNAEVDQEVDFHFSAQANVKVPQ